MTDEPGPDLSDAYGRLTDSAEVPHDADLRVSRAVRVRRRRRRWGGAGTAALVVAVGLAVVVPVGGAERGVDPTGRTGGPGTLTPSTEARPTATEIACETDLIVAAPGFRVAPPADGLSRLEAARAWPGRDAGDRVILTPDRQQALVLRQDGSAYAQLGFEGDADRGYAVAETATCRDRYEPLVDPPTAPPVPTGLTCPTELRGSGSPTYADGDLDLPPVDGESASPGPSSGLQVVRSAAAGDNYVLADGGRTAFVLRADGTAYSRLRIGGDAADGYRIDSELSCEGESVFGRTFTEVELDVGHCWVGTLDVFDRDWELLDDEQIDSGGSGVPDDISGRGIARQRFGDATVEYLDDAGGRLTFYPAGDPRTTANDVGPCR